MNDKITKIPILMISPSRSFRWSGMPWQIISFTDLPETRAENEFFFEIFAQPLGRTCRLISENSDNSTERGTHYAQWLRYALSRQARRSRFPVECVMKRCQAPLSRARQRKLLKVIRQARAPYSTSGTYFFLFLFSQYFGRLACLLNFGHRNP